MAVASDAEFMIIIALMRAGSQSNYDLSCERAGSGSREENIFIGFVRIFSRLFFVSLRQGP